MFLVSTLAVPVAVLGGAVPASAGTTIQTVPGKQQGLGVACPSASICEAAGWSKSSGVVTQVAIHTVVSIGGPSGPCLALCQGVSLR
jgi:hypothetical protein